MEHGCDSKYTTPLVVYKYFRKTAPQDFSRYLALLTTIEGWADHNACQRHKLTYQNTSFSKDMFPVPCDTPDYMEQRTSVLTAGSFVTEYLRPMVGVAMSSAADVTFVCPDSLGQETPLALGELFWSGESAPFRFMPMELGIIIVSIPAS